MANPVQWTVTEFWRQLQTVENLIHAVETALNADRTKLSALYAEARKEYDPAGAHDRAYLEPLIHQNSVLRISYLAPVKAKFNGAVASASAALRKAGYNTPNLTGLGVVPALIIVPVAAATLLGIAYAAVLVVNRLTQAQITRTATAAAIFADPNTTPAQKLQLAAGFQQEMQKEKDTAPPPPGFDTGWIVPAVALVAAIVLGPQLLRSFGPRKGPA